MLTNDTSFRPCSVSLYFSLPRKSLDCWIPHHQSDSWQPHGVCLIVGDEGDETVSGFVLRPLGGPGSPYFQSSYPCLIVGAVSWFALPSSPLALTFSSPPMRPGITSLLSVRMSLSCLVKLLTSINFKIWVANRVDEINIHGNYYINFVSR
jgi:hypothetical protein